MYTKPIAKSELEKVFFNDIENETPENIKNNMIFDLNNKDAFVFRLERNHLYPDGLGIYDWFSSYEKEAKSSTAGIRGLQNPLYPWDTRYPINVVGIILATLAKALVIKEKYGNRLDKIYKLVSSEVRYNSELYVDLISRVQAAQGIKTYRTPKDVVIPIWMTSYLIFTEDFCGGEYVTSSHALSKKIATKDLNFQGSQFIPEESILFVEKIREILKQIEDTGSYLINVAASNDPLIDSDYIVENDLGIKKYVNYLSSTVASDKNLQQISSFDKKIVIDCMGGSMYPTLDKLFTELGIRKNFDFINKDGDPFFHDIGKIVNKQGKIEDLGCDSSIVKYDLQTGNYSLPVINTMKYEELLKPYEIGTLVLITDPDGDRLITSQIVSYDQKDFLDNLGVLNIKLDEKRLLAVYMPNQSFLMTIDCQKTNLKNNNFWKEYDWFIIKTTASSISWDEWADFNNIPVINTPVGFKEIATILQKVESKYEFFKGSEDIFIEDVFGKKHNLGNHPRLLFAGEESGGEIFGPVDVILSRSGKKALAMREKSAGEAIVITSMMYVDKNENEKFLHHYLSEIFNDNNISGRFDVRVDQKYYNESEPDINKLREEKQKGILIRTSNDTYFLSIALMHRMNKLGLQQIKEILSEAFPNLKFDDLEEIYFVGDGTYLRFSKKFVEVRPSGTDAINKAYSAGNDWNECVLYSQSFAGYSGERNPKHFKYIPEDFYNSVKELSIRLLMEFQEKDLKRLQFIVPDDFPK